MLLSVHTMKVNGVQHCFKPRWISLYGQKQLKHCLKTSSDLSKLRAEISFWVKYPFWLGQLLKQSAKRLLYFFYRTKNRKQPTRSWVSRTSGLCRSALSLYLRTSETANFRSPLMYEVALFPGLSLKAGCKALGKRAASWAQRAHAAAAKFALSHSISGPPCCISNTSCRALWAPRLTCLLPLWADTYVTSAL